MQAERPFRVRHYECDAYGHLNNTTYLHYLEEVEIETGGRRPGHIDIRYVSPVSFGDTVVVTAHDADGGRGYEFLRGDDLVYDDATNEVSWEISWEGVDGEPTAMHFHGPALAGEDAGVVQGIGVDGIIQKPFQH